VVVTFNLSEIGVSRARNVGGDHLCGKEEEEGRRRQPCGERTVVAQKKREQQRQCCGVSHDCEWRATPVPASACC